VLAIRLRLSARTRIVEPIERGRLLLGAACLLIAGGVAAALVLAFSDDSSATPSKAEYFARVAAICRTYGPQLDKIDPPHDIAIPGEVVGPVRIVLPLIVMQTRDLHALRPPKELAGEIEHWLALKDRAIETLKRTLREGLLPDVRLMGPDWLLFVEQNEAAGKAASKIGFPKVCTSSTA
jgi:hypothetical protein